MLAVWRACRTLRDIIAGTTYLQYLQYLLSAEMNGVEDLLPPSVPYSKRLELLQRHEESWCGLNVNLFTQQSIPSLDDADCFILQGGYLIYECLMTSETRYGYMDLCSAARNEELRWVHVTITLAFPMGGIRSFLSAGGIFAVLTAATAGTEHKREGCSNIPTEQWNDGERTFEATGNAQPSLTINPAASRGTFGSCWWHH